VTDHTHTPGRHRFDQKRGLSQRLFLGDWMPLTHGLSEKSFGFRILDTLPMILSGILPTALQFEVSLKKTLKQERSTSLATWHVHIPGKIIIELSVHCSDHQDTGGDLEGAHVPPGWGDWYRRIVGKHHYSLSMEEALQSCSMATYHRHGNTSLGACHWRRRMTRLIHHLGLWISPLGVSISIA